MSSDIKSLLKEFLSYLYFTRDIVGNKLELVQPTVSMLGPSFIRKSETTLTSLVFYIYDAITPRLQKKKCLMVDVCGLRDSLLVTFHYITFYDFLYSVFGDLPLCGLENIKLNLDVLDTALQYVDIDILEDVEKRIYLDLIAIIDLLKKEFTVEIGDKLPQVEIGEVNETSITGNELSGEIIGQATPLVFGAYRNDELELYLHVAKTERGYRFLLSPIALTNEYIEDAKKVAKVLYYLYMTTEGRALFRVWLDYLQTSAFLT